MKPKMASDSLKEQKRVVLFNTSSVAAKGENYVSTTKYTLLTFFPKALYEQFRRVANVYFTIMAALSCTEYSPVHPITTFSPLLLVLGVSLAREGLEDYRRLRADHGVNNRVVDVFDHGKGEFRARRWRDVCAGDVVAVDRGDQFPADLLFLCAENKDGVCFVETANLDGENNLKIKSALFGADFMSEQCLACFEARVECELPNASLYTFAGNIKNEGVVTALSPTSLLLRGCSLRNTPRIVGGVIFVGHESKVMMNATCPPSKRTRVEKRLDWVIFLMFVLLFSMCVWGSIFFAVWTRTESQKAWYIAPEHTLSEFDPSKPLLVAVSSFITSFIIYGYLIPISLYVSMETVKVIQATSFIAKDVHMYDEKSEMLAMVRTSNLNEELGMVQTVLSDKTGTLTCNVMEFFKCSIGGVVYGEGATDIEKTTAEKMGYVVEETTCCERENLREPYFNFYDPRLLNGMWRKEANPDMIRHFFRLLAICHTVIPDGERTEKGIVYESESPDELALVVAAKKFGHFFCTRTPTSITVAEKSNVGENSKNMHFEILNILEFTSTRKRMSVICRDPDGRLILYCKGADTVIYERLDPEYFRNVRVKEVTMQHMEEFGSAGLRTICLSYVELDSAQYDSWQLQYVAAKTSIKDRDQKVEEVGELIEKNLRLLGCTAIEDKLQDGVPQCIEKLSDAGIKLWILTGDKRETAINIGFACSVLRADMIQYMIDADTPAVQHLEREGKKKEAESLARESVQQQLQDALKDINGKGERTTAETALIIDGKALSLALTKDVRDDFVAVGTSCKSVLCCRVSPKQKMQVTGLVRKKGLVTLAIGDGANDVGMIQEADIGVGISGQEGMQAVLSSDFSIAQFRFLLPLLLVHGRWCYKRITRMVAFFFYKNVYFGLTIFFYNAMNKFSGQLIYDDYYMSLYNVIFTSLVPLAIGILDQDVDRAACMEFPGLYLQVQRNKCFSPWVLAGWFFQGVLHSLITMAVVFLSTAQGADRESGETYSHWHVGIILFSSVVITVHVQIASVLDNWTLFHHLSIWGSVGIWFLYLLGYGAIPAAWSTRMYMLFLRISAPSLFFWLIISVVPCLCVVPGILARKAYHLVKLEDHEIIQEMRKLESRPGKPFFKKKVLRRTISPEELSTFSKSKARFTANKGYVPGDVPGSVSYFTPQSTLDQIEYEAHGVSRHPVVAKLEKELSINPYRHRDADFAEESYSTCESDLSHNSQTSD